jgi:SAM-dependent methyltransferase
MTQNNHDSSVNARIWEDLYRQGKANLAYPNSVLVSLSYHLLDPSRNRRLLDYGFGAGANLLFFVRRGFDVCGVEVSKSAVDIVADKLRVEKLHADLKIIEQDRVPFEDAAFDAVIAWQVLYYNTWETLHRAIAEIDRILRPGGIFIGTMAAIGDISQQNSSPLGDGLYQSSVPGQENAVLLVVDKDQLPRCFPGKVLKIGSFSQSFEGMASGCHWVISYRK